MNKKGFTLVELIAVVVIIGIIAMIAVPNIVNMVDNGKKTTFVSNAEDMVSKAKYFKKIEKYQYLFATDPTNSNCKLISLENLGLNLDEDPDGNTYDKINSKVRECNNEWYVITVSTDGSGYTRGITSDGTLTGYIKIDDISKRSVKDFN